MGSYLIDGRPNLSVGRQCSFCLDLAMEASRAWGAWQVLAANALAVLAPGSQIAKRDLYSCAPCTR